MSDAASNHPHPALLSGRLVAPDLVISCIEVRSVQCPEICKYMGVLHYCTFGLEAADDAQSVRVDRHSSWKR